MVLSEIPGAARFRPSWVTVPDMNIKKSQSLQCNLPLQQPNQGQDGRQVLKVTTTHLESYNRAQGENSVAVKHFLTKIIAFKKELNAAGASVPSEKRRPFQSALHFHRKLSLMRSWLNPQGFKLQISVGF